MRDMHVHSSSGADACFGCKPRHQPRGGYTPYHQERFREYQAWVDGIKLESGCVDCGYNEHAVALDFDHVSGEKKFPISTSHNRSRESVIAEMEKCEVVCANCHRVRTLERRRGLSI